jgi:antitoxin component YwqK of YwqJK toxin-antitoxin module
MRKFIFLAFVVLATSCGPKLQEKTIESFPDGNRKRVQFTAGEGEGAYIAKEVFYYQNGQKKLEGTYNKEGKKDGKWIYWREDGKLWSEGYFAEGKDDGLRKTWHENGQKHYQGKYDKGKRVGTWKFYDESGKLVKEIDYDTEPQQ